MTQTLVDIRTMRQSTMGTADICLHRLDYVFDPGVPRKGSVLRSMGTGYHAGLAYYYSLRRQNMLYADVDLLGFERDNIFEAAVAGFEDDVAENELFDWRYQPKNYRQREIVYTKDEAIADIDSLLTRYFDNKHYWPERYEVLATEIHFELPYAGTNGWTRSGTIDLVLRDTETGWHHVTDHKMSRKKWAKPKSGPANAQAAWYMAAWAEYANHKEVTFAYDVISLDGEFHRIEAHRTPEQIAVTLERGRSIVRLLEQGGPYPPNPSSFLCSEAYCDYWNLCAFGKTLA